MDIFGIESRGKVFSAFTVPFTPPATPTDVFIIEGAVGVTVKVLRMFLSTLQTTAGINTWSFLRHSTANSGGTEVATSRVIHTPGTTPAAQVRHYTTNPTPGTSLGSLYTARLNSPAATTAGTGGDQGLKIDFIETIGRPVQLQGTTQGVAINFGGAALPAGLSVVAGVVWMEE